MQLTAQPPLDALHHQAAEQPRKVAAISLDRSNSLTYSDLDGSATAWMTLFKAMGLREGETIALLLENSSDALGVWWGARRAGLYYVPLSTRLVRDEVEYILRDSEAKLVVFSQGCESLVAALKKRTASEVKFVRFEDNASFSTRDNASSGDRRLASPGVSGREMIYSSGTTGRPKGIRRVLMPASRWADLPPLERRLRELLELDTRTKYLSVAPLHHATGRFLNRVIEAGGTAVIAPAFEATSALRAIEEHRITHSMWVPTMFRRLHELPEKVKSGFDLSSHRVALHGAAPCSLELKRAMIEWWGPIVHELYGGSENAGVTFIRAQEWLERPGSVGRSIIGSIHILDDESREVPPGIVGSIYFDGGVPFSYTNGSACHMSPEGYVTYGDLGSVDEEGYLYISDRRTDLVIRGGVNIYPKEVELVLEEHSAVREAAVIGVSDCELGQEVHAIVCLRSDPPTVELAHALIGYCRTRISSIKCPRAVHFVDDLPRNEHGKVLKRILRERFEHRGATPGSA